MDINNVQSYILSASIKLNSDLKKELKLFTETSKSSLKGLAPVDKGDLKNAWQSKVNNFSGNIYNTKDYASNIELGSKPGAKPWPMAGKKTTMSDGRIYSSQAVGGTIRKVINDENIQLLVESLGKLVSKSFR